VTRLKFDQFAKQYLEEFLTPFGTVERQHEVSAEPRFVFANSGSGYQSASQN